MCSLDVSQPFTSFQCIASVAIAHVEEKIWKIVATVVKKYSKNSYSSLFFSTEMLILYCLMGFVYLIIFMMQNQKYKRGFFFFMDSNKG